jgi:hypothetical protein
MCMLSRNQISTVIVSGIGAGFSSEKRNSHENIHDGL